MSTWSEERRRDKAADAEQRRLDKLANFELKQKEKAAQKAERRTDVLQRRRDRRDRRRERMAAWTKNTTPELVYRRGTLALVTASALASLPAQIRHFVSISALLLPLPFALEGAAWVMAAGVAYADERKLPAWVRWLLRVLCLSAAGFAGYINYGYGAQTAPAVGWGLAAVTMLGPLFFEVRQWVATLTVDPAEKKRRAEQKARAKHTKRRRKNHKDVTKVAGLLLSAAPFGSLSEEDAWASAWSIVHGTPTPGMTPALHAQAVAAKKALDGALKGSQEPEEKIRLHLIEGLLSPLPDAAKTPVETGLTESIWGRKNSRSSQVENQMPPTTKTPGKRGPKTPQKPPRRTKGDTPKYVTGARIQMAETARLAAVGDRIPAVNGHHH